MPTIADVRQQYPQYSDMSDQQLADALYAKFYADMPRDQFNAKIGLTGKIAGALSGAPAMQGVNPAASNLPGMAGQVQNTARAAQSGAMQGMTFGFGDEINAGLMTPIEMGIDLFQGKGIDPGRSYQQALDKNRALDRGNAQLNPTANVVGEIAGGVGTGVGLGNAGVTLMKGGASIPSLIGRGAAEGAIYGGLYGAGKDEGDIGSKIRAAGNNAALGAATGAVLAPAGKVVGDAIDGFRQNRATSAAIKNAPSAADLRAASSQMFRNVDNSGVTVDTPKFSQFVQGLASQAKRDRINPTNDPKAFGAFEELIGALNDVQKNGGALTVSDMHTLRQIAQRAAVSTEGRDAMFANRIVDGIDNFVTSPGALKLPGNRIGNAANAGNEMLNAISTWSRSRKVGLVEEAIYKAGNQASGVENGLRIQFRQLIQNPKTRRLFSKAELQQLEKVANGTMTSNLARLIGKFGFGGGGPGNVIGGSLGLSAGFGVGGPFGALAAGLLGYGARKAAGAMTNAAAERAARVVATPGIPQVPPVQWPRIGGAGGSASTARLSEQLEDRRDDRPHNPRDQ